MARGNAKNAKKIAKATRTEHVFPGNGSDEACKPSYTRPVWRLLQGEAQLVGRRALFVFDLIASDCRKSHEKWYETLWCTGRQGQQHLAGRRV